MRVLRGAACLICSALLVLLVPSSAWSDETDGPQESPSSSESVPCSPEDCPVSPPSSEDSSSSPPSSESVPPPSSSSSAVPDGLEAPSEPEEPSGCGSEEAPCTVTLPTETEAWMLFTAGTLIALLAALLVTQWGRS